MKRIVRFILDNVGTPISANRIVGTFKADVTTIIGRTIDACTIALTVRDDATLKR